MEDIVVRTAVGFYIALRFFFLHTPAIRECCCSPAVLMLDFALSLRLRECQAVGLVLGLLFNKISI